MRATGGAWQRGAFVFAACALALSLTVSANLLFVGGIDYAHPGGNPLVKLHPSTWATAASFGCLLVARRDPIRALAASLRREKLLASFLGLMTATMLYSMVSVGVSGASVYIESYLSAGLLALSMRQFTAAQRRTLGLLVLGLLAVNASLALAETLGRFHLVPVYLEESTLVDEPGAFRSAALFDHPLTGAMLTMTGLLVLFGSGLRIAPTLAMASLFGLALVAFGGRTALGVTVLIAIVWFARTTLGDLYRRRLRARRALGQACLGVLLPCGVLLLAMASGIGGRIAGKLYLDASAQSRGAEWLILGLLDLRGWLFGSPIAQTPALIHRIGLESALTDIENFWLLAFVNLGLVGFVPFLVALACLFGHLWRVAAPFGRVAVAALLVTASTSNSLGRKSNVLFILVACVEAGAVARARAALPARAFSNHRVAA